MVRGQLSSLRHVDRSTSSEGPLLERLLKTFRRNSPFVSGLGRFQLQRDHHEMHPQGMLSANIDPTTTGSRRGGRQTHSVLCQVCVHIVCISKI